MSRNESCVDNEIIRRIITMGGWAHKVHGNQYNTAEPDIDGCLDGVSIKVESKKLGRDADPLQRMALERWRLAGAVTGVCHSVAEFDNLWEARD